ncbi:hypothetical protein L228DRAFT_241563 [Xylona heveae TC161]|uniref:Uncharacterized protein n=1 Tax=Xylona heveae (strain CBS 132557 / TC161) TaxID=1328760 RepID=A0A164ZNR3_XYLHT|nr:hypothetical protein L228DRAFT_241563 [Xylona heveae TC161]KZF19319.1 hypothetical protein L228DRAFT_241563 [Xylona heveae TC161]
MDDHESEFDTSIVFGELNPNFVSDTQNQDENVSGDILPPLPFEGLESSDQALDESQFEWLNSNRLPGLPSNYYNSYFNYVTNNQAASQYPLSQASVPPLMLTGTEASADLTNPFPAAPHPQYFYNTPQVESQSAIMPGPSTTASGGIMTMPVSPTQPRVSIPTTESLTLQTTSRTSASPDGPLDIHHFEGQTQARLPRETYLDPVSNPHQPNIQAQLPVDLTTTEDQNYPYLGSLDYHPEFTQMGRSYEEKEQRYSNRIRDSATEIPRVAAREERDYNGGSSSWNVPYPDIENPTPAINLPQGRKHNDGYQEEFADWRTVQRYRVSHFERRRAGGDPTIPRTNNDCQRYVKRLFLAMSNLENTRDNAPGESGTPDKPSQAWRSFHTGKYSAKQIQAVCWELLMKCIDRQQRGPLVPEWQRTSNKAVADFPTLSDRVEEVCKALTFHKTVCKRLMDSIYIDGLVDNPKAHMDRAVSNKKVNLRKADVIRAGRRVKQMEGALRQGISDPSVRAENTPEDTRSIKRETSRASTHGNSISPPAQERATAENNSTLDAGSRIQEQPAPALVHPRQRTLDQDLYLDPSLLNQSGPTMAPPQTSTELVPFQGSTVGSNFPRQGNDSQYYTNTPQPPTLANQLTFDNSLGSRVSAPSDNAPIAQMRQSSQQIVTEPPFDGSAEQIFRYINRPDNKGKFLELSRLSPQRLYVKDKQTVTYGKGITTVIDQNYYENSALRDLEIFERLESKALEKTALQSMQASLQSSQDAGMSANMAGQSAYPNLTSPYPTMNTDTSIEFGSPPYFTGSGSVSLDPRTTPFSSLASSNLGALDVDSTTASQGTKRKRPTSDTDSDYEPIRSTRRHRKNPESRRD